MPEKAIQPALVGTHLVDTGVVRVIKRSVYTRLLDVDEHVGPPTFIEGAQRVLELPLGACHLVARDPPVKLLQGERCAKPRPHDQYDQVGR